VVTGAFMMSRVNMVQLQGRGATPN
jgi:hypothetical protein